MATAISDTIKAIYTALAADAGLTAIISTRLYDDVPDNTAYPYVAIGEVTENRSDTFANKGKELTATIHVWSQYRGMKQLTDILTRLDAVLDQKAISFTNWTLINIEREFGETIKMPDGITRQLVTRYRVMVQA